MTNQLQNPTENENKVVLKNIVERVKVHNVGDGRFLINAEFICNNEQNDDVKIFEDQFGKIFSSSINDLSLINERISNALK